MYLNNFRVEFEKQFVPGLGTIQMFFVELQCTFLYYIHIRYATFVGFYGGVTYFLMWKIFWYGGTCYYYVVLVFYIVYS